jgi:hypothetical protein
MATSCIAEPTAVTDPDLLELEFEAIIAANYPPSADHVLPCSPDVRPATTTWVEPHRRAPRRRHVADRRIRIGDRRPRARQRSPPRRSAAVSTDS